jgi:Transglutaminase-like superfamily
MLDADLAFWRNQSPVSHPGASAHLLGVLPADPDALTEISSQMVFHYRADGDWEANGMSADRAAEINLCYAADMFDRLLELEPSLSATRSPAQRILGCCRDFSTLYVSMLRHHQIPSRCRVGFASYFEADWWIAMWWSRSGTAGTGG